MVYPPGPTWFNSSLGNKPKHDPDQIRAHTWAKVRLYVGDSAYMYTCRKCGAVVTDYDLQKAGLSSLDRNLDLAFWMTGREPDEGKEDVCPRV
jgi:hypothetical protein